MLRAAHNAHFYHAWMMPASSRELARCGDKPAPPYAKIPLVLMARNSHIPARLRVVSWRLIVLLLSVFLAAPRLISAGPAAAKSSARHSGSFQERMALILRDIPRRSFLGVLIVDAATGQPLYQLNAGALFHPASTTKLFTSALALSTLGPGYQIQTTLEIAVIARCQRAPRRRPGSPIGRGDPQFFESSFSI